MSWWWVTTLARAGSLDGTVAVDAAPEGGARFTLRLPVGEGAQS